MRTGYVEDNHCLPPVGSATEDEQDNVSRRNHSTYFGDVPKEECFSAAKSQRQSSLRVYSMKSGLYAPTGKIVKAWFVRTYIEPAGLA